MRRTAAVALVGILVFATPGWAYQNAGACAIGDARSPATTCQPPSAWSKSSSVKSPSYAESNKRRSAMRSESESSAVHSTLMFTAQA